MNFAVSERAFEDAIVASPIPREGVNASLPTLTTTLFPIYAPGPSLSLSARGPSCATMLAAACSPKR